MSDESSIGRTVPGHGSQDEPDASGSAGGVVWRDKVGALPVAKSSLSIPTAMCLCG